MSCLQGGLEVSDNQLWESMDRAQQSAAALRDLILEQRPDANWTNREDLLLLIDDLELEAATLVVEARRQKLIDLADELNAGKIKHRFESRVSTLNELRSAAVAELRDQAALPEPETELPGPQAPDWIHWACNLHDDRDAEAFVVLRECFPALEQFAGEMEESYWVAANPGFERATPPVPSQPPARKAEARPAPPVAPAIVKTVPPEPESVAGTNGKSTAAGGAAVEPELTSTVSMYTVPSRLKNIVESTPVPAFQTPTDDQLEEPVAVEADSDDEVVGEDAEVPEESSSSDSPVVVDAPFTFGVDPSPKKPLAVWIAAGVVAAAGLAFLGWHYFGSGSNDKSGVAMAAASKPAGSVPDPPAGAGSVGQVQDPAHPAGPSGRQPIEGAQHQLLLNVEQCLRMATGNVECKGYVTNLGAEVSRVTLDGVDVVDGKGNTFNLNSNGQVNFSTGRSSSIAAGAREAYTVKVPDKDPDAKTLTLYVDVNNPHGLEYTFRDVPIAGEQSRNGG